MSGNNNSSQLADDELAELAKSAEGSPAEQPGNEQAIAVPSVGQQLRAAREAAGLSPADVIKTLKLSAYQIEALEADDWTVLPCNTIVRGFVRNYARLLKLDPDQLMGRLHQEQPQTSKVLEMPVGTKVSMPQEGRVAKRDTVTVLAGLVVLALAVTLYFFVPQDFWKNALTKFKASGKSPEPAAAVRQEADKSASRAPVASIAAPNVTVLGESHEAKPASAQTAAPVPEQAITQVVEKEIVASVANVAAVSGTTGDVLKFSFAQPSWVEVRDKNGEIIFSQLSPAGSQKDVEGKPPFSLVVGNATHVSVQYRGKPVDLSKRSRDDVARVTVE